MKVKFWLVSLLLMMVVVTTACGPAAEIDEPTAVPSENEDALETAPRPTPTVESEAPVATTEPDAPEAYPPQPTAVPPSDSYPAPAEPQATVDPYPEAVDGFIWMLLPVGVQCEEESSPYSDLQDAVAGLTAVDVTTGESEVTELLVCTACGCPTSAHYRVQVSVEDVSAAQVLGWTREP